MQRTTLLVMILVTLVSCPTAAQRELSKGMQLTSIAFKEGGEIPKRYTCDGRDISPPLAWTGVPAGTKSLVLIVDDPDAPDPAAPRMTWVHWVLFNIPPETGSLPEGVRQKEFPAGTLEGRNDWSRTRYGGPCPPKGTHRYYHKLYALDTVFQGLRSPAKENLEKVMLGHILARAELVGKYRKR
jgi:Raf kinase inhibitor-like YbhB/YbcL family protein